MINIFKISAHGNDWMVTIVLGNCYELHTVSPEILSMLLTSIQVTENSNLNQSEFQQAKNSLQ